MIKTIVTLLCALLMSHAQAHKASDAYLSIENGASQSLKISIALRDLDQLVDSLDADNNREITVAEVKSAMPQLLASVLQGVALRCKAQEQGLSFQFSGLEQRSDGVYWRAQASLPASCEPQSTELRYRLMQGIDADHRAILSDPQTAHTRVVTPSDSWISLQTGESSALDNFVSFVVLGMEHIGSGADHIAFVICLVLGLQLWRDWRALLTSITAFTIGHSITLVAATLGMVGAAGWVEPVIALSIGVCAIFNITSMRSESFAWAQSLGFKALLAASFGLVHGLGFSGAMTEAKVTPDALPWALAGFNFGVEIGQLLIIAAWSAAYFTLHRWKGFTRYMKQGGSVAMIALSLYWLIERL